MAFVSVNLPAPSGNGSGAAVDTSGFGGPKTITVNAGGNGTFAPFVLIEISNDLAAVKWSPLVQFETSGEQTIAVACKWMRATVSNFKGGAAPIISVGGEDDGTLVVVLPVPVGDGPGAGVDTSALGLFKTVQVAGPFRGAVNIEVSDDGGLTYETAFSFPSPGQASQIVACDHMRVKRSGVPDIAPGLPLVGVAGTSGPSGSSTVNTDGITIKGDGSIGSPIALKAVQHDATLAGLGTVPSPLSVVSVPLVASQVVYVSKGGNDLSGTGGFDKPFLTIQRALTSITDATTAKRYQVSVGPGEYADPFQIKPWTSVVGVPAGTNGATPDGFTIVEITAPADTCGFDASWGASGFSVGWYAQLGFVNHQTWVEPVGSQPQLNFQGCAFDSGATYTGPGTSGTDNVSWIDCLSFGGVTMSGWQFLWLRNCTFLGGTITVHSGPPGATESSMLLAMGCAIGANFAATNVLIQWAAPSPAGSLAKGDLSDSAIVGTLTLDGANTSYTATAAGIPPTVILLNGAPGPTTKTSANGLGYTPGVPSNWVPPIPATIQQALDKLAAGSGPTPGFYGIGQLGDVVLNAGGTVLASSISPFTQTQLFFHNLTISNGTTFQVDTGGSGGGIVVFFIDGTLSIEAGSFIDASGSPGGALPGSGGTGGANSNRGLTADGGGGGPGPNAGGAGGSGPNFWSVAPKMAGAGGAGGVQPGGAGPAPGVAIPFFGSHLVGAPFGGTLLQVAVQGNTQTGNTAGGGGGGSDNAAATGGGGGGGGGILIIFARHISLSAGCLRVHGGAGENASGLAGNAGGGGGGLGGVVLLVTQDSDPGSGVANVLGGAGGTAVGATGVAGSPASRGEVLVITPAGTTWTH